jgi:ATP-dependent DNA ligase
MAPRHDQASIPLRSALYTRNLREVTPAVPEVVEIVRASPARSLVLDGEVIALRADQTPQPFQITMRRFGRRLDVDGLRAELPLTPFFVVEGQGHVSPDSSPRPADATSR